MLYARLVKPLAAFFMINLLCLSAGAVSEHVMTTISNDRNRDLNQLSVLVDNSGSVQGIAYATIPSTNLMPNNERLAGRSLKTFSLVQLASAAGVVLDGDSGHDVFILQGSLGGKHGEGDLTFKYLTNGLSGSYASCQIGIRRSADGKWFVLNLTTRETVTKANIETWSLGISAVHGLCPKVDFENSY